MSEKTVYTILNNIQKNLIAPKGNYSDFGKYHYRSCEDILSAVKPYLDDATLLISDDIVQVGDRFYVCAIAKLVYNEQAIETKAFAREPLQKTKMDDAQVTGSASSYARKYALNGLFAIDDVKDPDARKDMEETERLKKEAKSRAKEEAKKPLPTTQHQEKQTLNNKHPFWKTAIQKLAEGQTTISKIKESMILNRNDQEILEIDVHEYIEAMGK